MTLASARAAAGQALAALSGYAVHAGPPDVLVPPAVVLRPGDPWLDEHGTVTIEVGCVVRSVGGNTPRMARLEQLVEDALAALAGGGFSCGPVRPGPEDPDGQYMTAVFEITHREC